MTSSVYVSLIRVGAMIGGSYALAPTLDYAASNVSTESYFLAASWNAV